MSLSVSRKRTRLGGAELERLASRVAKLLLDGASVATLEASRAELGCGLADLRRAIELARVQLSTDETDAARLRSMLAAVWRGARKDRDWRAALAAAREMARLDATIDRHRMREAAIVDKRSLRAAVLDGRVNPYLGVPIAAILDTTAGADGPQEDDVEGAQIDELSRELGRDEG